MKALNSKQSSAILHAQVAPSVGSVPDAVAAMHANLSAAAPAAVADISAAAPAPPAPVPAGAASAPPAASPAPAPPNEQPAPGAVNLPNLIPGTCVSQVAWRDPAQTPHVSCSCQMDPSPSFHNPQLPLSQAQRRKPNPKRDDLVAAPSSVTRFIRCVFASYLCMTL